MGPQAVVKGARLPGYSIATALSRVEAFFAFLFATLAIYVLFIHDWLAKFTNFT